LLHYAVVIALYIPDMGALFIMSDTLSQFGAVLKSDGEHQDVKSIWEQARTIDYIDQTVYI